MRVFMVACSSRAMNQPTNQSIAQLFCGAAVLLELLRRSCPAPLIVRPQSRPSMSGRSRWDGNPRRGWWAVGWEDNSTAHVGWSHDGGWWRNVEHDRRDAVDHANWWSARAEQAAAIHQLVAAEQAAVADEQAAVADSNVVHRGGDVDPMDQMDELAVPRALSPTPSVQPPDADLIEMQKGILKEIQLPHLLNELHNVYWRVVERSRTPSELKRATQLDEEITHDESMFCKVVSRLLDIGLQEAEINNFNSVTDPGYAEIFREWVRSACFNHDQTAQIIQSEERMERNEKQAEATLDAEKAEENEAGPNEEEQKRINIGDVNRLMTQRIKDNETFAELGLSYQELAAIEPEDFASEDLPGQQIFNLWFFQSYQTPRPRSIHSHALKYFRQEAEKRRTEFVKFNNSHPAMMCEMVKGGKTAFSFRGNPNIKWHWQEMVAQLDAESLAYVVEGQLLDPNRSRGLVSCRLQKRMNSYDHKRHHALMEQGEAPTMDMLYEWDFVLVRENGTEVWLHPSWNSPTVRCNKPCEPDVVGFPQPQTDDVPLNGLGGSSGPGTYKWHKDKNKKTELRWKVPPQIRTVAQVAKAKARRHELQVAQGKNAKA